MVRNEAGWRETEIPSPSQLHRDTYPNYVRAAFRR